MNNPGLRTSLRQLFPDVSDWAIAPLLGATYSEVPHLDEKGSHKLRLGPHPGTGWEFLVQQLTGGTLVAECLFDGRSAPIPFGCVHALLIKRTGGRPLHTRYWRPQYCTRSPLWQAGAREARAREDLLRRWRAIPDQDARELIQSFWIGHEHPALAELGMGTLNTAALARVSQRRV
jgi:hypothetical protein